MSNALWSNPKKKECVPLCWEGTESNVSGSNLKRKNVYPYQRGSKKKECVPL